MIGTTGLILLANYLSVRNKQTEKRLFGALLFLLNLPVLFTGLVFMATPADLMENAAAQFNIGLSNFFGLGLSLLLMGGWGALVTLIPVRRILAKIMRLDAESPVHTLALVLTGYLVGQSALTWSQGGVEGLTATAEPASISYFILSEILFAVIAFLGVGVLIRRNGRQLIQRLGLVRPQIRQIFIAVALIWLLVFFQWIAGVAWAVLDPEQASAIEDLNTILLADMDTFWEWLLLALAAGIGEEILFRGALQPVMGLGFTAVIFALIHIQYGFSPILIFVIILSVILGLVRRYYNTTIAILVHVGYDFALGLLVLLATYLESTVS